MAQGRSGALHVWAEQYDREVGGSFELQDEIAQTVVAAIVPELSRPEVARSGRRPPPRSGRRSPEGVINPSR